MATLLAKDGCRVRAEFYGGDVYFHCRFQKWSVRALKTLDAAVPKMDRLMADIGFRYLRLFIPVGRARLYRFCERFGFREERRNNDWIFMQREVPHA